jgi:hypothetical protein
MLAPWCNLIGFAVFMLVLLCRQEICSRGKLLFLDKACIHQSDSCLKQRGIEHLAAFLYYSWNMLVCYSDEYLQKLWTVYEVSSFMLLHPGSAMHVSHPWYAKFLIVGMVVVFAQCTLSQSLRLDEFLDDVVDPPVLKAVVDPTEMRSILVASICQVPTTVVMAVMVSKVAGHWVSMSERIKRFRFNDAACYDEADRGVVQQNIIVFMKHQGHADKDASDADIICKFEGMIHNDMPTLFAASLGRVGFPYHIAACLMLPYSLQSIGEASAGLGVGAPLKTLLFRLAYPMVLEFAAHPLTLAIKFSVARHLFQTCQVGHATRLCILSALGFVLTGGSYTLLRVTATLAAEGSLVEAADFGVIAACYFIATFFFYKPRSHQKHRRHLSVGMQGDSGSLRPSSTSSSDFVTADA